MIERNVTIDKVVAKPFLRYVGGKRWFTQNFSTHLPTDLDNYYEPFLGSGAIFFSLRSSNSIHGESLLSDINSNLVEVYTQIRDNFQLLTNELAAFENTRDEYYCVRETVPENEIKRAARYIYLNRTSFGGIYRENRKGIFNVPYGNRVYKHLFDFQNLKSVSDTLSNKTRLHERCFSKIDPKEIGPDDFICLDPPYLGESDKFNRYFREKFDQMKSEQLIEFVNSICNRGRFLLFVGNDKTLAEKFRKIGRIHVLERMSNLSKGKNMTKQEIIIKNY